VELTGATALVTGGSRGIGRAVTLRLVELGAAVFVNYRSDDAAAEEVCALARARGGHVDAIRADVGDPSAVRAAFRLLRARVSRLDAIVHAAALGRFQPLLDVRPAEWDVALRTNAAALLHVVRNALGLLAEPGGRIVAVSSLGSMRYVPFYGAIGASKAALESVVRSLAVELAPRGVHVNAVSAGLVEGATQRRFPQHDAIRELVVQRTPAGRLATPEEVADVIVFLCSARARWICGQTIVADGGLSLT
jgi:enoyl-[acyl-carrier protein] reductase III